MRRAAKAIYDVRWTNEDQRKAVDSSREGVWQGMDGEKFDVMVVGAGPAGSFAAERLARAGVRVALFDGRPPDEPKACGGGVTSKALKMWPHLLEAVGRTVEELEMYSPAGKRLHLKLTEPFAIYSRRAFDSYLLERAREAGAHVISSRVTHRPRASKEENWIVRERGGGAEWSAPMLVAADGANSRIGKELAGALPPAEMEVAFGYRAPLPKEPRCPTVVAFLPGWAGYAWAFPRPDHISFGIATAQDAFDHQALDQLLWDFMVGYYRMRADRTARLWSSKRAKDKARDELIRAELLTTAERYAARIPGLAVKTWDNRRASGEGWALLGDAAGFADPVTGEGIYYALRSAELFAESYLEGRPSLYEERWREDFGRELRRAAEMRRRFYGNFWGAPFTERMIDLGRTHPGIRRVLGDLVAGDQGYLNLKRKLVQRAVWPL
ncbi:MAG TPA: NAD(P)/FAD-dependent oxidoreductase [Pyrinomonadaceae bacterium]